ncbi:MAG: hypothetical protein IKL23_07430, partial [Oscillospiraceae bacterium]|nr:hypothetical protein [Oscillospiraceae bacterium]
MSMTIPAFASDKDPADDPLEEYISISNPSAGIIKGKYEGRSVSVVTYPAGTVFTYGGYFHGCHITGGSFYAELSSYGKNSKFTLPEGNTVYKIEFIDGGSGTGIYTHDYYVAASTPASQSAPAAPSAGGISIPVDASLSGVTVSLTNVLDSYSIPINFGGKTGTKTVTVYQLPKTGAVLTVSSGSTTVFPGPVGSFAPKSGTFKPDTEYEDIGQNGDLWGYSGTNSTKLELTKWMPANNIFTLWIGGDTTVYYTFADLSAYDQGSGNTTPSTPGSSGVFTDVSKNDFYYDAVM